eukprot:116975-Alexandrium_andersonii.AAC.1
MQKASKRAGRARAATSAPTRRTKGKAERLCSRGRMRTAGPLWLCRQGLLAKGGWGMSAGAPGRAEDTVKATP